MNAKGMSATSDRGIQYFQWGFPLTSNLYFLSWDQRHTWKASLDIRSNRGLDAGLYWEYHSPRPFTYFPSRDGIAPDDPLAPFVPNNERMRDAWNLNVKVSQTFRIHLRMLRRIVLYADARNVFNRKNVLWMDASGRIGGELEDPAAYGAGRRTRAGLQFEF
jgi:outer membrane receptor protein involved in Fe transport